MRASQRPCWWCLVTPRNRDAPRLNPVLPRCAAARRTARRRRRQSRDFGAFAEESSLGKLRLALAPQYLMAALSYARAASSSRAYPPRSPAYPSCGPSVVRFCSSPVHSPASDRSRPWQHCRARSASLRGTRFRVRVPSNSCPTGAPRSGPSTCAVTPRNREDRPGGGRGSAPRVCSRGAPRSSHERSGRFFKTVTLFLFRRLFALRVATKVQRARRRDSNPKPSTSSSEWYVSAASMRRFPNPVVFKRTSRSLTSAMFRKHASASASNASFSESNKASHGCSAVLPTERKSLRAFLGPRRAPAPLRLPCPPASAPSSRSSVRAMQESSASFRANRSRARPRPSAGSRSGDNRDGAGAPGAGANVTGVSAGQGARGPRSGARPRTATRTGRGRPWDRARPCSAPNRSRRPGRAAARSEPVGRLDFEKRLSITKIFSAGVFPGRARPERASNPSLNRRDPRLRLGSSAPTDRNAREARAGEARRRRETNAPQRVGKSEGSFFAFARVERRRPAVRLDCQSPSKTSWHTSAAALAPLPSPPSCSSSPCSCAAATPPPSRSRRSRRPRPPPRPPARRAGPPPPWPTPSAVAEVLRPASPSSNRSLTSQSLMVCARATPSPATSCQDSVPCAPRACPRARPPPRASCSADAR